MQLHNCINYLLTVAQHEVFLAFSQRLEVFGVTPGQYGVLNCLWSHGPSTPKEIAQALHLENSTVSGVLDRMQKRGLINRLLDPNDRRSIRVEATAEAMAIRDDVLQTIEELNRDLTRDFTPEEKVLLFGLLRRIGKVDPAEETPPEPDSPIAK